MSGLTTIDKLNSSLNRKDYEDLLIKEHDHKRCNSCNRVVQKNNIFCKFCGVPNPK